MTKENPTGDQGEVNLWEASRELMGKKIPPDSYQEAQKPSREAQRRGILGLSIQLLRRELVEAVTLPIKLAGKIIGRRGRQG